MPAAPSLQVLYNFESQFETVAENTIDGEISGYSLYNSAASTDMVVPRVEINFELGEAEDPEYFNDNGSLFFPNYVGFLVFRIIDDISGSENRKTAHQEARAVIRSLHEPYNFDNDGLAYYNVSYIRAAGTEIVTDGDFLISELRFQLRFAINSDAFPTPA